MFRAAVLSVALMSLPLLASHQPPATPVPPAPPAPPAIGPIISLPRTLQLEPGDLVEVKAETGAELVTWDSSPGIRITYPKQNDPAVKTAFIHADKDRSGTTEALTASIPNGKETRVAICLITIGPRPPPPEPPGPKPPGPTPPPVPTTNLRVLFVYESGTLTVQQSNTMNAAAVRAYLSAKCVKGADGKTPEYRYFDKDDDVSKAGGLWPDMWAASKPFATLPVVIIFDGQKGTSYPLPANANDLLALLKKAGG